MANFDAYMLSKWKAKISKSLGGQADPLVPPLLNEHQACQRLGDIDSRTLIKWAAEAGIQSSTDAVDKRLKLFKTTDIERLLTDERFTERQRKSRRRASAIFARYSTTRR